MIMLSPWLLLIFTLLLSAPVLWNILNYEGFIYSLSAFFVIGIIVAIAITDIGQTYKISKECIANENNQTK